jgi:hypothetical protein
MMLTLGFSEYLFSVADYMAKILSPLRDPSPEGQMVLEGEEPPAHTKNLFASKHQGNVDLASDDQHSQAQHPTLDLPQGDCCKAHRPLPSS